MIVNQKIQKYELIYINRPKNWDSRVSTIYATFTKSPSPPLTIEDYILVPSSASLRGST